MAGLRVAGLLAGIPPNPVHTAFFSSVCESLTTLGAPAPGTQLYPLRRGIHLAARFRAKELGHADIALSESVYEYPALFKRLFRKDLKVVELFASPKIFRTLSGAYDPLTRSLMKSLLGEVDGFIAVSRMCRDFLEKHGISKPCEVAYPFVDDDKYPMLERSLYDPGADTIVSVGYPPEYKGHDLLLATFDRLCGSHDSLRLNIITRKLDSRLLRGLKNRGRVSVSHFPDAAGYCRAIAGASLCVHPGRFDTFPVSTLESMLAGLPTFVSQTTGTREVAESVGKEFVLGEGLDAGAEQISRFLSLPEGKKRALSGRFRAAARPFDRKSRVADFKEKFRSVASRL
ncbi:MAG: glycosyltransferase family 4 protein [Candidatus Micrarchaeota archaeon]